MQDLHWRPYTVHCSPCLANFTYIVDIEEGADQQLLIKRIPLFKVSKDSSRHSVIRMFRTNKTKT